MNVGISRSLKRFDNFRFHPLSAPMFAPASLGAAVGAHAGGTPRLAALPVSGQAQKMDWILIPIPRIHIHVFFGSKSSEN